MSESPEVFRVSPGRGAGVRRMNRRPLIILFSLFLLVAGVVGYTIMERSEQDALTQRKDARKPDPATSAGILDDAPTAGLIEPAAPPTPPPVPEPEPVIVDTAGNVQPRQPGDVDAFKTEWQQYRQQQGQVRQAQMQSALAALAASPEVGDFGDAAAKNGAAMGGMPQMPTLPSFAQGGFDPSASLDRIASIAEQAAAGQGGSEDPNNAKGKQAWLDSPADPANYLEGGRRPTISPYEVKTGTVIPGVMIGGIHSDLPGQIIAQVRENVWDTATGKHLLIPQGARLIGNYDNQITRGQSRVLVAWTRIIFPDASSIDLGSMPGADQGGFAGLKDKVNNHYWRVFGDAALMSLFSAGIQLSQPQSATVGGGYDSQQIIAGALGQQLGQTGMQITQRNLNIQPSLEIRPGYRFNVMVTKDMVLTPWKAPR